MKIYIITNLFPNLKEPNRGIFNFQQFSCLSKKSVLTVFAPISWLSMLKWREFKNLKIVCNYSIFHPIYFYSPRIFRCLYGIFYFLSVFVCISRSIKVSKPDAFLVTWAYPDGFAAVLIGKLYKIPVYLKVHGSDIHSVHGRCKKKITSWTLMSCNKIISVSKSLANMMNVDFRVPMSKINVIPNGIDKSMFYPMQKDSAINNISVKKVGSRNLIYIGNLKKDKNILLLVKEFSKMQSTLDKDTVLHILGDGDLYNFIVEIIDEYKLVGNICMYGSVEHSQIPYWLNFADALILPSKNEGMPNVVLEAMACGTPIIASDIDANRELISPGENGYLFNLDFPEDLCMKIKLVLLNQLNRSKLSEENNVISWEENVNKLFDVMEF